MKRWFLAVLDDDRDFADRLSAYVRMSPLREQMSLRWFTDPDKLESGMNGGVRIDVLLYRPHLLPRCSPLLQRICAVQLTDHSESASEDVAAVFKYQPLNKLIASLKEHYRRQTDAPPDCGDGTSIVAVYSAVGGCGKTTVAANMAIALAEQQQSVLYLNLETLASVAPFPHDPAGDHFSRLLYYVKTNPRQAAAKLEEWIFVDGHSRVEYVPLPASHKEYAEMTAEDAVQLLDLFAQRGVYRYIVVDLDSEPHEWVCAVLARSHHVWWLVQDDVNCLHKTAAQRSRIGDKLEGSRTSGTGWSFVLNKYTGRMVNDPSRFGIDLSGYLPYMPQWKSVRDVKQLLSEPLFRERIIQCLAPAANRGMTAGPKEDAV